MFGLADLESPESFLSKEAPEGECEDTEQMELIPKESKGGPRSLGLECAQCSLCDSLEGHLFIEMALLLSLMSCHCVLFQSVFSHLYL